jgi:hypothetical protein
MKVPIEETVRQAKAALERMKKDARCTICNKKAIVVGLFVPKPEWLAQFSIADKAICYALCNRHGKVGSAKQQTAIEEHLERELAAATRQN